MQTKVVRRGDGTRVEVEVSANGCTRCVGKNGQCRRWAIRGAIVCPMHGGGLTTVRRAAIVRAELDAWGLDDQVDDPGEVLLRLVSQSARRVAFYASLLEQAYSHQELVGEETSLSLPRSVNALIGGTFAATTTGAIYQTGEQIRGLVVLEAQERDRCAAMATKAIAAGLAERQVRIAEQQGQVIIEAITLALDSAGVTGEARAAAQNAAADHLLALTA